MSKPSQIHITGLLLLGCYHVFFYDVVYPLKAYCSSYKRDRLLEDNYFLDNYYSTNKIWFDYKKLATTKTVRMEVIHYFLIFLVINLGLLYWFQQSVLDKHPSTASVSNPAKNNFSNQKDLPTDCQGGTFVNNKCRLAGLAGPATGFHQAFKPSVGRELGWRGYFIRKFGGVGTSQTAANDDGLQGTLTQNYLANLPSTDNIYRQTDY